MTPAVAATASATPIGPGGSRAPPAHGRTFHQVVSALNPLQYLPVVGTIYRAVTGDTIPEAVRRIGSLIVSGIIGGPVGIAINIATTAAEKITGIDLDQTGQAMLHGESLGQAVTEQTEPGRRQVAGTAVPPKAPPATPSAIAPTSATVTASSDAATTSASPQPWSSARLVAYGVQFGATGTPHLGGLQGADMFNTLELARLHSAYATYAQIASLAK